MYFFAEVGHENFIASLLDFHSNFFNWLLLVGILFFLIKKFVPPVIAQRQLSINNELAAAAKTRQDAEQALAERKRQIEQASHAAEKIVVEAKQTAKQMVEEMHKQTEQDAADLLKKFEMSAHNERQAAILEMRSIVAKAAIKLTEENLQSALTSDNRAKIAQEFMGELSRGGQSNIVTESPAPKNSGGHPSGDNHRSFTDTISSVVSDKNLVDG